jgi:glutathione S-transferase
VETVIVTELVPQVMLFSQKNLWGKTIATEDIDKAIKKTQTVLSFLESLLGEQEFFIGAQFTLAEIVAGSIVPVLPHFKISLENYPQLSRWSQSLLTRESWQSTQATPAQIEEFRKSRQSLNL